MIESIATHWAWDTSYAMPAYEDFWHHLGKERGLPANVEPHDSKLDDKEERIRLARVFETRPGPAGLAMCCRWSAACRVAGCPNIGRPAPAASN